MVLKDVLNDLAKKANSLKLQESSISEKKVERFRTVESLIQSHPLWISLQTTVKPVVVVI